MKEMNDTIKYISGRNSDKDKRHENLKIPSVSCGLTEKDVQISREKFGENILTVKKQTGFFRQFLRNLNDPIIKILICALIINTAFMFSDMNWAESAGIALTVFISAFVTTVSEHSSGTAFEKLYSTLSDTPCHILRDGVIEERMTSSVVRYDVVHLYPGDMIPADGILIHGTISCDESPLTGESREIRKFADDKVFEDVRRGNDTEIKLKSGASYAVFRGSHVVSGNGVMLVTAVGDKTMYGSIATELADDNTVSPLKTRLSELARTISKIGYVSAVIVALVHLADAFWFDAGKNPVIAAERLRDIRFVASEAVQALTMAISVIVVAVPEGLPMMITVVLSSNMKKMLKSGVLVRRLIGIETAGSVDILFTDKTGTLTTGKLTVSKIITGDGEYHANSSVPSEISNRLRLGAIACSSVFNPTERAIYSYVGLNTVRTALPDTDRIPFDSAKKYAVARYNGKVYIRGAAEYLLPYCMSYLSSNGKEVVVDDEWRYRTVRMIQSHSDQSCRILLQAEGSESIFDEIKNNGFTYATPLIFTALFVIRDEVRKEAIPAVSECHKAGIKVVMLTGDNERTAAGIAKECGILPENHRFFDKNHSIESYVGSHTSLVIDGQSLKELNDEELTALLPCICVISRVTPTDKSRLVRIAKNSGHVTGMTGDGINDAPAIKAADVGFAMGSGTDVAREAGDIVITDDNFVSVTQAVLFGRTIFESIRKFITFQLTMNLAAVGVSVLGPIFGIENPVTVIQMLWVNIIMDTLGSLAFSGEPALAEYMSHPPIKRDEHILNGHMVRQIILTGGYAVILSMFFLISPSVRHMFGGSSKYHLTLFFALFIFMGIGIAMCTRTERINLFANIGKNGAFMIIMPLVAAIQLLMIYFGGEVFRCVPLDGHALVLCAVFAFTVIPFDTIRKCVYKLIGEIKKR